MSTRISWTWRAQKDLIEIGDFIAKDKPQAAARWVDRLISAVERAATFPTSGRPVPELGREDIREVIVDRYRIVYQVRADAVVVLTVFESHRNFDVRDP
jgi:addiction module RelE/StbE family toxin